MIASWRYGSYRIMAVIVVVVFVVTGMAVTVSAEYLNVDKYGLYDINGNLLSLGFPLPRGTLSGRWSLSGVSSEYTYDCWIQITFADSVSASQYYFDSTTQSYYCNSNSNLTGKLRSSPWETCNSQLGSMEKVSDKSYKIHLYWNSTVAGYYSATLQLAQEFGFFGSGSVNLISQGVGVYYDPGGDIYEEILNDIKNQLHAGDDKLDSIPSNNTELETKVSEIESVESSIVSASDPDGDAVDKFAEQGKSAVSTVNTSYRATFAFINGLVTKVMDDLGFGTIVFVSLTLGLVSYILGRIK